MTPVSAPNGSSKAGEADICDTSELPSDFATPITLAAFKGHGEKPIFF